MSLIKKIKIFMFRYQPIGSVGIDRYGKAEEAVILYMNKLGWREFLVFGIHGDHPSLTPTRLWKAGGKFPERFEKWDRGFEEIILRVVDKKMKGESND